MMRVMSATCVMVAAGCSLVDGFDSWQTFAPAGQVYRYEGKSYDVYQGVASGRFSGEDTTTKGLVLFPRGTAGSSITGSNVRAVCWEYEQKPCNEVFGAELRASVPKKSREDSGMGY